MREIKFRAITREGKIIKNVGKIEFFEDATIIVNDEIPIEKLIQYTGLKDKNRKEIYEGDIITDTEYLGEVVFHDRWHDVGMHSGKLAWCVFNKKTGEYITLGDCGDEETWEIIGNIYENPELRFDVR